MQEGGRREGGRNVLITPAVGLEGRGKWLVVFGAHWSASLSISVLQVQGETWFQWKKKKKVESSQTLGQTPNFNLYMCVYTQALIPAHISAHTHTNKYIYHTLDTTHIDKMFQKKRHCFAKRLNSLWEFTPSSPSPQPLALLPFSFCFVLLFLTSAERHRALSWVAANM